MKGTLRALAVLTLFAALLFPAAHCGALAGGAVETPAQAAALIEASTGKVLYSREAHKRLPMASTTKIMTAAVVLERCALSESVEVPDEACGTEGSSMYLSRGEVLSVEDLLYGLMLTSGNDAAVALAVHAGGSVEGFAALMNQKAAELGAVNTNFVTPNGLHDEAHYTSAYDLALISAYAMKNEAFREITAAQYHKCESGGVERRLKNKNKILWEYDGGNGIKTGYTKAAGKCLAFSAERDGMLIVGTVLNCPDMFESAKRIMDYGFEYFQMQTVIRKGDVIARVRVAQGQKNMLELCSAEDIIIPVRKDEKTELRTNVKLMSLTAPVERRDKCGSVEVYDETRLLASADIVAKNDVAEKDFLFYLNKLTGKWTA